MTTDRRREEESDDLRRTRQGFRLWTESIRPKLRCPCCGHLWGETQRNGCPTHADAMSGYMRDAKWFREHPEERWHVRELTLAEQLSWFLASGEPATHLRIERQERPVCDKNGNVLRVREFLDRRHE